MTSREEDTLLVLDLGRRENPESISPIIHVRIKLFKHLPY